MHFKFIFVLATEPKTNMAPLFQAGFSPIDRHIVRFVDLSSFPATDEKRFPLFMYAFANFTI